MIRPLDLRLPKWKLYLLLLLAALIGHFTVQAQSPVQQDRFELLEKRLKDLSASVPGLNQKADLSVNNISLQDFLKGLASTHNLNLNIDPSIAQRVSNYLSDESVANILLYLARQFNLDFTFIGTIITIK